jgi:integrase
VCELAAASGGPTPTMSVTDNVRSLRHGANVVAVSKLLGHASIATTQKYTDHLAIGEQRAAIPHLPLETD